MSSTIGKYRWTICALLFFATTINYLDRQVLSLLQPTLEEKFGWTNSNYANIAAAFQFTYAVALLFAGKFIDKIGTKKGYIWAIVLWSLGAMLHAWAIPMGNVLIKTLGWIGLAAVPVSVLGFIVSRAVLAIGEAGNFPAAIKATAEYFPKRERSYATGIFNSGANIGAVLAPLSVPWIESKWGWEAAFIVIGVIGFVWLFFWIIFYDKPDHQKRLSAAELAYIRKDDEPDEVVDEDTKRVTWTQLIKFRQTWSFILGKFLTDGVWWFFLFWLPAYLKNAYGLEKLELTLPLTVLYSITMIGSVWGGWFPMYFINKGMPVYQARMRAMIMIAIIPLVVLLAQPLGGISMWLPVLLIGIGTAAHQAWSANLFTTVSDMFPKKAVGSVVGMGGMAGGIGGVIITKLGGYLFDHFKALGHLETGYTIMFAICAVAYVIAWAAMKALVPRHKLVKI
ncbi:MAG: MFS transporter [Saprospiraceae bacterium]|nr:MFS transporter [Saprospiraceae bacterium]